MIIDKYWREVSGALFTTQSKIPIRSRGKTYVYVVRENSQRVLACVVSDEEKTIRVSKEGEVTHLEFEVEEECYIRDKRNNPVGRTETDVFTSLDRPPTMSPEMEQLTRMVRKNELDRTYQMEQMRKEIANVRSAKETEQRSMPGTGETSDEESEGPQRGRATAKGQSGADVSGEEIEPPLDGDGRDNADDPKDGKRVSGKKRASVSRSD